MLTLRAAFYIFFSVAFGALAVFCIERVILAGSLMLFIHTHLQKNIHLFTVETLHDIFTPVNHALLPINGVPRLSITITTQEYDAEISMLSLGYPALATHIVTTQNFPSPILRLRPLFTLAPVRPTCPEHHITSTMGNPTFTSGARRGAAPSSIDVEESYLACAGLPLCARASSLHCLLVTNYCQEGTKRSQRLDLSTLFPLSLGALAEQLQTPGRRLRGGIACV